MDVVRRHMFVILCGIAAAAGVAFGALGFKGMPAVAEEMEQVRKLIESLDRIQFQSANQARIEAEVRRIEQLEQDRDKVFDKARKLYGYDPLVEGVFPAGENLKLIEFRDHYAKAMQRLFDSLKAGSPASATEISTWHDVIDDEQEELRADGIDPDESGQPTHTPAGVLTIAGARNSAPVRAHVSAARRIYCYAVHFANTRPPQRTSSLDFSEPMKELADVPYLEDVWSAQVGYWIQKDVVQAIAAINDDVAAAARKRNEDPWVGIMPVKDVISIRLSEEYVPRDGVEVYGDPPEGTEPARPPGTPETVFTHSGAESWYDVMQFSVKLVMDQRDIPLFVDRLCKNGFHTLLRVAYESVPPNRRMTGKIYGSEPVVRVVMDFETIMLGDVFRPLMPQEVCEFYEIDCPVREEIGTEDGD